MAQDIKKGPEIPIYPSSRSRLYGAISWGLKIWILNLTINVKAHCALKSSSCRRIYGSLRPLLKALGHFLRAFNLFWRAFDPFERPNASCIRPWNISYSSYRKVFKNKIKLLGASSGLNPKLVWWLVLQLSALLLLLSKTMTQ